MRKITNVIPGAVTLAGGVSSGQVTGGRLSEAVVTANRMNFRRRLARSGQGSILSTNGPSHDPATLHGLSWRGVWDEFRNWLQLGLEARERA
jgi:hypothetical protein